MTRRRAAVGSAALAVLLLGGVWWRDAWIVTQIFRSWAAATVAEKSDGVYRLEVGRVRFNFPLRRVIVDSITVTTDSGINAARPEPLASLRFAFHQCAITGVHLVRLVRGGGLSASSFGCRVVRAAVVVPAPPPGAAGGAVHPDGPRPAFLVLQQRLKLPPFAPGVRIAEVDFPDVELDFRVQHARAGETRLQLERFRWRLAGFAIDPADTAAAARPLFSRTVELRAANFVAHPDSSSAVRVAGLVASLTDSTLDARDVTFAPTQDDAAFARSRPYRRALIKTSVGRIAVQGLDVGAFVLGLGMRARRVELDSVRLDVLSDRRRPANPSRRGRRTPQGWIAALDRTISVDSIVVRHGEIVYRERHAAHPQPGLLTFARLEAVAVNVRHVVGRRTSGDPMTLSATAYLQNVGRLDARFVVPLDAPRFDLTFRGTLGAMPVARLNQFIQETLPLRLSNGRVAGISFHATVVDGVARGMVTPRYQDLSVAVTRRGSVGILGDGGILGGAARGIASLLGNLTQVRAANPAHADSTLVHGTIHHTFTSDQTLPAFIWLSVRGGLLAVVKK